MLFMVIETFEPGRAREVYARLAEGGRRMPAGLSFVDSWVDAGLTRCFQLVECAELPDLQAWVAEWDDLVRFEIVPVVRSETTRGIFAGRPY